MIATRLTECRDCKHSVSRDAVTCPHCGCQWPEGKPSEFFESNRKATLRKRTHYRFSRALIGAILLIAGLVVAVLIGMIVLLSFRDGWEHLDGGLIKIAGAASGFLLIIVFLAQLCLAIFDIADSALSRTDGQ